MAWGRNNKAPGMADHVTDNSMVVLREPEGSLDSSKMSPGTSTAVCYGYGPTCLCFLSRENKGLVLFTAHQKTPTCVKHFGLSVLTALFLVFNE